MCQVVMRAVGREKAGQEDGGGQSGEAPPSRGIGGAPEEGSRKRSVAVEVFQVVRTATARPGGEGGSAWDVPGGASRLQPGGGPWDDGSER